MSLPSNVLFYNANSTLIAKAFINVGWIIDEDALFRTIRESYQALDKDIGNNSYYEKIPSWKEDVSFIKVYGVVFGKDILDKIVNGDQSVKKEIYEIIAKSNK